MKCLFHATNLKLICLSFVVLSALITFYTTPYTASNLDIVPDSVEYAVGSAHIVSDLDYFITIDGMKFPPRYSPAFSIILAPAYWLFGHEELGNAIYIVTFFSVIGVVAAYAIGYAISGCSGGLLAAGFMLLLADYLELGRKIMADVPGAVLLLVSCWLYIKLQKRQQHGSLLMLVSGCVIALSAGLRPALLVLVLPHILQARRHSIKNNMLLFLPIVAVIGLTFIYNLKTFGSFLRNGYNYWCPIPYDFTSMTLSLSYLKDNVTTLLSTSIVLFIVVITLCVLVLRRSTLLDQSSDSLLKEIIQFAQLTLLPYLVFHLFYFYQDTRFFLPITCLLATITGGVVGRFINGGAYIFVVFILCSALISFAVVQKKSSEPLPWRRNLVDLIARSTPEDAVIIAATDPVYLSFMTAERSHRIIVPFNRDVEYASKLIAPKKIDEFAPPPAGWWDHRANGLVKAGAIEAVKTVAVERPDIVNVYLNEGRRVFLLLDVVSKDEIYNANKFMDNFHTSEIRPGIVELKQK